ncbi:hypothetical protein AB0O03_28770 [Streptomyces diastaticus]|uniref:hypothetical protein n=1 Tax=Streptomyces diastaticus TaxID=1956 RepID=UPI0034203933
MSSRKIARLTQQLDAIRGRELWPLTAAEQARIARDATIGAARAGRSGSTAAADRRIEETWRKAEARVQAEAQALAAKEAAEVTAKAAAKAGRKGWF